MKITITFSLIILLCSCAQQSIDKTTISTEVKEVFDAYTNHVNTKGLEGVEIYFSSDDRFFWVEDGISQYPNHQALKEGISAFAPSVKSVLLKVKEPAITPLSRSTASLHVEYIEDIVLKSGYEFTLDGAMTIILLKENGSWKFFQGHSSIKKPRGN